MRELEGCKSSLALLKKCTVNYGEEESDLTYVVGVFLPRKLKLISERFQNDQPTKRKPFLCEQNVTLY